MARSSALSMNRTDANIVVPATSAAGYRKLAAAGQAAAWDGIELRLDLMAEDMPEATACGQPLLLTARHPSEGGAAAAGDTAARSGWLRPWLPLAWGVDVEIAQAAGSALLLEAAREAGTAIVLSMHDFEKTPATDVLHGRVEAAIALGADIVKVAARTESRADVARLLSLFAAFPAQRMAVMGMGRFGKASRLAAAAAGSVLNYCSAGEATAEGQWEVGAFRDLLVTAGIR